MNAYLEILRPVNGIMTAIAVVVGYMLASQSFVLTLPLAYAAVAAFLIMGGGMVINDYYDYAIDRKIKPKRPLPSGRITKKGALFYSAILMFVGISFAAMVNETALAIAMAAAILLFLYAKLFSRMVLVGNVVVALNTGLAFIFGAAVDGNVMSTGVIALFGMAIFATLAREFYKSIEDMKGDKKYRKTLPMAIGRRPTAFAAGLALVSAVMISPIPYWAGVFSGTYLLLISLVDAGFIYTALHGVRGRDPKRLRHYCKVFQMAALVAFLAGIF